MFQGGGNRETTGDAAVRTNVLGSPYPVRHTHCRDVGRRDEVLRHQARLPLTDICLGDRSATVAERGGGLSTHFHIVGPQGTRGYPFETEGDALVVLEMMQTLRRFDGMVVERC